MDLRNFSMDTALLSTLQDMLDLADQDHEKPTQNTPSKAYIRDAKAMAATPADIKEYPNSYEVQLEDNVLVVSGERKREKEEGVKFLRMERRLGKLMRKFQLPENANTDAISAVCRNGVLVVTVQKVPPPEPKRPKIIDVKTGH